MAYSKETKAKARSLYVHNRLTIPTIAIQLNIAQGTVARWKADAKNSGNDWDILRSSTTMAADGQDSAVSEILETGIIMIMAEMDRIRQDEDMTPDGRTKAIASLSDSFNKLVVATTRVSPKLSRLGVATEVLRRLAEFVRENFPQHKDVFLEILEPFGVELTKAYAE